MIYLKNREEIELIREAALMVSRTLGIIAKEIKPGVLPISLDKLAEEFIRDNGGIPAFKGFKGGRGAPDFPATLCISINEAVVHGIPTNTPLKEGDMTRRQPDNTKMKSILNRELISIEEGIKRLMEDALFLHLSGVR